VWYRVSFDAPGARDSGTLMALYIDRVCASFEVYLNGQLVHRDGAMVQPPLRNCQRPQLVALPGALTQATHNTLDIKVVGHPLERVASHQRAGGLSVLDLGPYAQLAELHARRAAGQRLAWLEPESGPLPQLDVPHFRYGQNGRGGVGQGDGEVGQPIARGDEGEEGENKAPPHQFSHARHITIA